MIISFEHDFFSAPFIFNTIFLIGLLSNKQQPAAEGHALTNPIVSHSLVHHALGSNVCKTRGKTHGESSEACKKKQLCEYHLKIHAKNVL